MTHETKSSNIWEISHFQPQILALPTHPNAHSLSFCVNMLGTDMFLNRSSSLVSPSTIALEHF